MKKILVFLLALTLVMGMVPCGLAEEAAPVSIDFEDGNFAFLGVSKPNGNAADATIEIADFNGSKALKVTAPDAKSPYVAINADGLLGENIAKVRSIRAQYGIDNAEDGAFWPVAGKVYSYIGEKNDKVNGDWSVYMDFRNPNTVTISLKDEEAFVAGAGNYIEISKETDNYVAKTGGAPVVFYIDNIEFLDADGNPLPLDLSAEYVPAESGVDTSNLWLLKDVVEFEGFVTSGGAWSQNGFEMPEEIKAALVPGSVVEIEFSSENGDMWIVMPWAEAGWIRVGGGGNGTDYVNNAKNIAQIPYETFVEFLGNEDVSTWGAMMQCEASGAWQVFGVRVGQRAGQPVAAAPVEFDGFVVSAGAWAQDGLEMTDAIKAALVPGAVVEIEFESASGDMWIVMPDSANTGWTRVQQQTAAIVGNKAYITYEQIAEACQSENVEDWGARMQCEASGDWSVFGVRVGTYTELPVLKDFVNFEGFTVSAGAWAQDGLEMTDEIKAALVPGAVVDIEFESASGDMWIVMPWAEAGWMRVAQGTALINGSHAYITYEQIAEVCGDDIAAWGAMMQCEASDAWSVYSVRIAQNANAVVEAAEEEAEPEVEAEPEAEAEAEAVEEAVEDAANDLPAEEEAETAE